jgi:sulfatase modifying factor 1
MHYKTFVLFLSTILLANLQGQLFAQSLSPRMVSIPGGTFWQGSREAPYAANERANQTRLSPYLIGETEVTQELWTAVMKGNPSKFPGKDRPVEFVSWLDAVRFCNALSAREGLEEAYRIDGSEVFWNTESDGYRLPTEAEWEYAARGGPLAAMDAIPLARANYAGGTDAGTLAWYDGNSGKASKPVGQKQPNELGLYDMSGNVWEWCWDWYGEYPKELAVDPQGAPKGSGQKVLRGGAWFTPVNLLRTTYRYWNVPAFKVNSVGFRVARNADPVPDALWASAPKAEALSPAAGSAAAETTKDPSKEGVPSGGYGFGDYDSFYGLDFGF